MREASKRDFVIPPHEYLIEYTLSGGHGGQNVNKVSTAARLFWNVGKSRIFSPEEKNLIRKRLKNRLNAKDEIYLRADEARHQGRNGMIAIGRLHALIQKALEVPPPRRKTRPSRSKREERLEEKKKRGEIKSRRKKVSAE